MHKIREIEIYFLPSDLFEKRTINAYLRLEICVGCMEFLAFKYVFIDTNQMIINIFTLEILNT